jgi:hypothetical protein
VREEIGDVMIYLTEQADKLGIDPVEAARAKLRINEEKYPATLVREGRQVHGVLVTPKIFVFTAGDRSARQHLADTKPSHSYRPSLGTGSRLFTYSQFTVGYAKASC